MERLTNKNLVPILKYENLINSIYNSYKPIEDYIKQETRSSYKDLDLQKLRKKFNFKKLYENNIKLFEIINQFNLNLFDFVDTNVRQDVKDKYGKTIYDLVDKVYNSELHISKILGTVPVSAFGDYKDYFSFNYDKTTGKFALNNLPNGEQVDIDKYVFKQNGTLKEPKDIYKELKKDYNLVEFDLNSLKSPYKEIVSNVLENLEEKPKVLSNIEIKQIPVDPSTDWLTQQYSSFNEKDKFGEEIYLLLGGKKVVVSLPGEFNSIDSFNYHKVVSNDKLVNIIYCNEDRSDIYDTDGDVNQELINRYLSDNGEYKELKLENPIEYSLGNNKGLLDKLIYYEDNTIDIKPIVKDKSKFELSLK